MHHKRRQFADLINFDLAGFVIFCLWADNFVIWVRPSEDQAGARILRINFYVRVFHAK